MKRFTNLYQVSKTLRFELKPEGKTKETFEKWLKEMDMTKDAENLFAKDKKIRDAYLVIKPIMDKMHELFIEMSLSSDEAKKIDFSKYFEIFKDKDKDFPDGFEKRLRGEIGATYSVAGKFFSSKIHEALKNHEDNKDDSEPKDNEDNEVTEDNKDNKKRKKKPFECLTDAKMLKFLSANAENLARENGISEQTLTEHINQFNRFWLYLKGYNQSRENYYETDEEASTAVATRIVHENLPTFCSNIQRFEKQKEEYLHIYQYLKDNNCETKIKNENGEEVEAEPITETVFRISHFNQCLAQSQIEEYNRIIGNCNSLINLYKQSRREDKIDEFEKLYKQIGCGKKKSLFATLVKDKECELSEEQRKTGAILTVEQLLKRATDVGDRMFRDGDKETEINTVPAFVHFLRECDNWDGIYMSKATINKISNRYFSDWHSIEDRFIAWYNSDDNELKEKAKACITYDKKREEPLKLRDAVELSVFFEALDKEESVHFFKESLFKNEEDNEYCGVLKEELSPSRNLINLLCFDIERNIKAFLKDSDNIARMEKYKDENNQAGEEDENIRQIKDWFDAATDAMRVVRFFAVRKSKMKGNIPNVTMEQALSNLLYSDDAQWFKWYDLVRNYLTKKPQGDVMENKLKLNFNSGSFLRENGWDNDYSKSGAFIVIKDKNYYLVVVNEKLEEDELNKLRTLSNNVAKRVVYKQNKMDFKNFPRWFIYSTGNKLSKAVEKYHLPIDTIRDDYDKYRSLSNSQKNKFLEEHPKFRYNLIEYFKKCAPLHESLSPFKDRFDTAWRKTEEYNKLSDFYKDTINACYEITFEDIDFDALRSIDKFYLFQIYNKDFSTGKDGGNGSTGKHNMHTIYWEMLFDENNLKDVIFKLDGQGAEIFMRKPLEKVPITHSVGSKLVNKRDKEGNTIPERIYRDIYAYANDNTKKISADAQKYIDEDRAVIKDVKHEIIKDNRFYGETKYLFHCPITINFRAKKYDKPQYAVPEVNAKITDALQQSENLQFIGIDRGEKHLVYSCTIDKDCKIIKCHHHDNINGTDYVQKLETVADKRIIAKKNWQQQNKIKDLKTGYISHVVHRLVDETIKDDNRIAPHAYIVLEDLNTEMKRGRQKIEKQVYQNLELALAKKFNFVVDKDVKQGELGSVSLALQLTPPVNNYQDIEGKKQFGVMLYTRANYTSITDPATGWRKTIYIKNGKDEDIRQEILNSFSDFGFDDTDYFFDYTEAHAGHSWRMYSGKDGRPLPRFQNKKQPLEDKNIWVPEPINVVEIFNRLFANFDKKKSFKAQIEQGVELVKIEGRSETAWQSLRYTLDLIQQIRNSGLEKEDDNFLFSPVRGKDGEHFDTRKYQNNGELSEIKDADANGAYNIARKGLIMDAHIKEWIKNGRPKISDKKDEKTLDLDLFISDKEWDLWLLDRDQWKKELPTFASRRAKESDKMSQTRKSRMRKH